MSVLAAFVTCAAVSHDTLPFSFCIACNIESVDATVPAQLVYHVSSFHVTVVLLSVVALPTLVTSPVRLAFVVTVLALPAKFAVMVPAEKLPEESRSTRVDHTFVEEIHASSVLNPF